jgi:hypothetical protein
MAIATFVTVTPHILGGGVTNFVPGKALKTIFSGYVDVGNGMAVRTGAVPLYASSSSSKEI